MAELPDVTALARVLADQTRAQLIDLMLDGQAHTLLELTRAVGVTPSTGTYHLQRLVAQQLVRQTQSGRHHYFALASPAVATAFETLSSLAPARPVHRLSRKRPSEELAYCRTCYDHLAGCVGVALCDALLQSGALAVVDERFTVTPAGQTLLTRTLGLDWSQLRQQKRQFTVRCLDWSQRRYHLGGAVGHAVYAALLTRGLVARASGRSVVVTPAGRTFLKTRLGVTVPAIP